MKLRNIALFLAVCLLLAGCNENSGRDPDHTPTFTLPDTTQTQPTETELPTEPPTEPEPTEPDPAPQPDFGPHGFDCGLLVQADGFVYAAEPGCITRYHGGEGEIICYPGWQYPGNICTNGKILLYINGSNMLMCRDLETGREEAVGGPYEQTAYLDGAMGRDGATYCTVYISLWSYDGWAPENRFIDLSTGDEYVMEDLLDISSRNGYLFMRDFATDVSAREMTIFDPQGNKILDRAMAWQYGFNNGVLWYAPSDCDYLAGKYADDDFELAVWVDDSWQTIVHTPLEVDWTFGGYYVDDAYYIYGGSPVGFYVDTQEPLDAERNEFLSNVTLVTTVGDYVFYKDGALIWYRQGDGDLVLYQDLGEENAYNSLLIADGIYAYTESGVLYYELP